MITAFILFVGIVIGAAVPTVFSGNEQEHLRITVAVIIGSLAIAITTGILLLITPQ